MYVGDGSTAGGIPVSPPSIDDDGSTVVISNEVQMADDVKLDKSLEKSISMVEESELQDILKEAVIDLWEEMEAKFDVERKPKKR